jgi:PAS domain S-box-containing protein
MHDIAPHGRAAAALVASALQEALRAGDGLLDGLPVAVYTCDREGRLAHYNRRAAELWGQAPAPGDPHARFSGAYRLRHPDGGPLPPEEDPMRRLLRTGEPIRDLELVIERPDGTRLTVLAGFDALRGPEGGIVGGMGCLQDITERKRAEAAPREQRFAELLQALPAAIYTTDALGRITFYNQAAADLWGCRPELGSALWCGSWRLFRPDGTPLPHDECPMAVALKEGRPVRGEEAVAERPDGTRVPFIPYPTPLRDAAGVLVGAVNMLVDITERKRAEDTQKLLIGELNHRVKNTLATVQAIARQTLQQACSPAEFVPSFSGRLQALARAHALLTRSSWRGADLAELLREQLLLDAADDGRIIHAGPEVVLAPDLALHLAMILHELGTNARKHGALTVPGGRLVVSWTVELAGARTLRLRWSETGGPLVRAAGAPGFGTALIEQSVRGHDGEARMLSDAEGVSWEISLPLPSPRPPAASPARATAPARPGRRKSRQAAPQPSDIAGRRVLVVEDEPLLALDVAASLAEAGIVVVGPAGTLAEAARLIETARLDAALVDANLHGEPVDEIAATLTRRGIPFAFVTGYGRDSLPPAFRGAPLVAKPFDGRDLVEAARRLLARSDGNVLPLRSRSAAR